MIKQHDYAALEIHFMTPKHIVKSKIYNYTRFPRKLKKKVKLCKLSSWLVKRNYSSIYWEYLGVINNDYKRFLIKKICYYQYYK